MSKIKQKLLNLKEEEEGPESGGFCRYWWSKNKRRRPRWTRKQGTEKAVADTTRWVRYDTIRNSPVRPFWMKQSKSRGSLFSILKLQNRIYVKMSSFFIQVYVCFPICVVAQCLWLCFGFILCAQLYIGDYTCFFALYLWYFLLN